MTEHFSKAGAFAAGIARRYGDVPLVAPMLDMIVRLTPHPSVDLRSFLETRVLVAPQIAVTVNRPPRLAITGPDPGDPHRWAAPPAIVRRLAQRQHRVEPGSPARPVDLQPSATAPSGPTESPFPPAATAVKEPGPPSPGALPMIVCRRPTPTSSGTGGNDTRTESSSPHSFERQASRKSFDERRSAGAPPAIDVERLTDKVVRAIDRRIVAYRERTARS